MELTWDYTAIARYTTAWPPYSPEVIENVTAWGNLNRAHTVADIGAGWGRMTVPLATTGAQVHAVEPNAPMREMGRKAYTRFSNIHWHTTAGEQTGLGFRAMDMAVFASSLHTMDFARALHEAAEILKEGGWLVCLWDHRNLNDPLQNRLEELITGVIPGFHYGAVKQDYSQGLDECGKFSSVQRHDFEHTIALPRRQILNAFRGDLNLVSQAGDKWERLVAALDRQLESTGQDPIPMAYVTRVWTARR